MDFYDIFGNYLNNNNMKGGNINNKLITYDIQGNFNNNSLEMIGGSTNEEILLSNGNDYRGNQNKTRLGYTCQDWNIDS